MPRLTWLRKDKLENHHNDVPFRLLDRKYTYGEPSENMLIHGDNLDALKALLPRLDGKIKCIYIEIITQSLIQFDFAFLPRTQKGASHIKRVHLREKGCNVKRYGKSLAMAV